MAGEYTGYYTYEADGSNHRLKGIHGSQPSANTAAATDTDLIAFQGTTEFPNGIRIGWIYDTTDSEWRPPQVSDFSDVDQAKAAAHVMMDVFDEAILYIQLRPTIWPQVHAQRAIDGIRWQGVNAARICLNSTRTAANRAKACEEAASWPSDANGDVMTFVDLMVDAGKQPDADFSWVEGDADPPGRVDTSTAHGDFASATNVEDAPSSAKLIGRGWINDIPA